MNYEHYSTSASTLLKYFFESSGHTGVIPKVIEYSLLPTDTAIPWTTGITTGCTIYNLGFGDLNPDGTINDLSVSNNGDMDKVLVTVANTITDFIDTKPDAYIVAMGSTPVRTRLYRQKIFAHFSEISEFFNIYGYKEERRVWMPFSGNTHFDAFLLQKKSDGKT